MKNQRGFIGVGLWALIIFGFAAVVGVGTFAALRLQTGSIVPTDNTIAVDTKPTATTKQPAAPKPQTQTPIPVTLPPVATTTPPPAPVTTSCSYTSNKGGTKQATPNQAASPEGCKALCISLKNDSFGQEDSGTCEFKSSSGAHQSYTMPPTAGPGAVPTLTLSSSVFVTPKGTKTLKFPQNWTPAVVVDSSSGTTVVTSKNPSDPSATLSLVITARTADYTTDADITKTTGDVTTNGGTIVSTTRTGNGYITEATFQATGRHTRLVRIETTAKIYYLAESSTEGGWSTYGPFYNTAATTLQTN